MKLVFYGGGDAEENRTLDSKLLSLIKNQKEPIITFIPACGHDSDEYFNDIVDQYSSLGVSRILRLNIDQPFSEFMKDSIFLSDIIHLGGGNTYYFLKHLKKSGMLQGIKDWALKGGILCGLSAGAIIMTPRIDTAGFPEFDKDDNEENIKNLNSMKLVNFDFFPHYRNSKRYDEALRKYSLGNSAPVYACPDGVGIIVEGEEVRFVGKVACFYEGKKHFINK